MMRYVKLMGRKSILNVLLITSPLYAITCIQVFIYLSEGFKLLRALINKD